jgi:hypothetical protein
MTIIDIQRHIQGRLNSLLGLPLSIARDAADMKMFHFGQIRTSGSGSIGEYALHVQCPWRIVSEEAVVTGSLDRFEPPQAQTEIDEDDKQFGTLQRVRLAALLKGYHDTNRSLINATEQFVVLSVKADRYGGLDIALSAGHRLQVFPCGSIGEDWRFFETGGKPHLVIGASSAEEID